jgi:hypothetical protein
VLAVFVAGEIACSRYLATYQEPAPEDLEFGAAVVSACGRGFINPAAPIPALYTFLQRKADAFSCDRLPADLSPAPLGITQALYRYLMAAVALQWRWSGVSWRGLAPLFGVMFGVTLCALYGLFRLVGGRVVGLIGVVPLAISAHHLGYLPQLRDYAKAPFILLLILLMAHLAMPPLRPRRSLILASVFGLILGIGFGFRNDILINLPPFLATVLLLTPGRWTGNLRLKIACLALASLTFIVSAWPILTAYRAGSNTGHVGVLGLSSAFDAPLGVTRPAYDLGSHYLDGYAAVIINTHSRLRSGRFVEYLSPEYDAAAFGLLVDVARHWPADICARGLASASQVLAFPFTIGQFTPPVPLGVSAPRWLTLYRWQQRTLRALTGLGPLLVCAVVLILGSGDPRAGIALVLFLLYYCGYPAVQFHVRHFFHLEFVAWLALAFVLTTAGRATARLATTRRLPRLSTVHLRNASIAAAAIVVVTVVPLTALRAYQQRHLVTLFEDYLNSSRTPLALSRATRERRTLVTPDGLWAGLDAADPVGVRYLVAEFASDRCAAADLPVTVKYDARSSDADFSFVTRVAIESDGPTFGLVPAYSNAWSRFAGFALPQGYEDCLKSVSAIGDARRIPVLVGVTLAPRWRSTPLFQRLATIEAPQRDEVLVQTVPVELVSPVDRFVSPVAQLSPDDVAAGVAMNTTRRTWFTPAPVRVTTPRQMLVHFPVRAVDRSVALRAQGLVRRGGIRIVTMRDEHGVDSRAITTPGPFTVLIGVSDPGAYGVTVTDESAMDWRQQKESLLWRAVRMTVPWSQTDDFELHDVAWVRSSPAQPAVETP